MCAVGNCSTVYGIVKHDSPGCHLAGPSRPPAHATEESDSEDEVPLCRKQLPPTPKKQTGTVLGTSLHLMCCASLSPYKLSEIQSMIVSSSNECSPLPGVLTVVNGHTRPGPVSRPSIRLRITKVRAPSESNSQSSNSSSESSASSSSSSSSSSHNSGSVSDQKRTRVQPQRAAVSRKRRRPVSGDSEDSYRPAQARRCIPSGRRRPRVGRGAVVRYHEDSDSDRRCTRNNDRRGRRRRRQYAPPDESEEDGKVQYDTRPARATNKVQYCEASDDSDPSARRTTRGHRTHYAEDSNVSSDDAPMLISVSSRGRIRKMTPRARAALLRS